MRHGRLRRFSLIDREEKLSDACHRASVIYYLLLNSGMWKQETSRQKRKRIIVCAGVHRIARRFLFGQGKENL